MKKSHGQTSYQDLVH